MLQPQPPTKYNLEVYTKVNDVYRHTYTLCWALPYAICKAKKSGYPKKHFEYLKIVRNK